MTEPRIDDLINTDTIGTYRGGNEDNQCLISEQTAKIAIDQIPINDREQPLSSTRWAGHNDLEQCQENIYNNTQEYHNVMNSGIQTPNPMDIRSNLGSDVLSVDDQIKDKFNEISNEKPLRCTLNNLSKNKPKIKKIKRLGSPSSSSNQKSMKKFNVPSSPKSINFKESISAQHTPYKDAKKQGPNDHKKNHENKLVRKTSKNG